MKLVSPLLKHVIYPSLSKAGYLRRTGRTGPVVLTYHGVLPEGYRVIDEDLDGSLVSANSFRQQLRFLQDQYNVITPEEFLHWCEAGGELPEHAAMLTCDDGLQNSLSCILPILQEFGFKCLFFVTGASLSLTPTMLWYEELYLMFLAAPGSLTLELPEIGLQGKASQADKRFLWWQAVRKLSQIDLHHRKTVLETVRMQLGLGERWDAEYYEDSMLKQRFLTLNLSEMRQLAAVGMCIGAHTLSHPLLAESSQETAWREISESKQALEKNLAQEIWALAYPFGDSSSVTSREFQMAEQASFKSAFLNVGAGLGTPAPKFAFPRVHITREMTLAEFQAHISGFHRSLQERFKGPGISAVVRSNA
jgi:peptidoglycan/xylan/chitin deacetylase (PgdA/CDA1 family)